MNLHIVLRLFAFVLALAVIPIAAQIEATQDDLAIEEETLRQKAANGESHASGARNDLGPVILGNPTQAAVAIRVGYLWMHNKPPILFMLIFPTCIAGTMERKAY